MRPIRALYIAGWLSSGGLASNSSVSGNSSASTDGCWGDHMRAAGYPPNAEVYDWVQQMHKNATAGSGITPGDLDCTILHSENCQPPGDGDCEHYNPAACIVLPVAPLVDVGRLLTTRIVQVIQTQVVNLYSILQAMDIAAIKDTLLNGLKIGELVRDFVPESDMDDTKKNLAIAAAVMWIVSGVFGVAGALGTGLKMGTIVLVEGLTKLGAATGVGTFTFNTIGALIGLASATLPDDSIDINKMEDVLSSHLGDFFQSISDQTAAITAKIFGGTPLHDVDLEDFIFRIQPDIFEIIWGIEDGLAIIHLFEEGWFLDQAETEAAIQPMFEAGFALMKVGLIGILFSARKFYVMHFTELDETKCKEDYEGASRFVDGGCFILKVSGGCINEDDNAWGELEKAEQKYNMSVENFFRNVRDCNNNQGLMENRNYTIDGIGDLGECFFPLNYLHNPTPHEIWNINQTIADSLNLKYQHYPYDDTWCKLPY
ncbi:hypothetical protein Hte_009791 [Hypoxylon texense]